MHCKNIFQIKNRTRQQCRGLFFSFLIFLLSGCSVIREFYSEKQYPLRNVSVYCDNIRYDTKINADARVGDVLELLGIKPNDADIVTPSQSLPIPFDGIIHVTRVTSEEIITEQTIPFQSQTIRNESLPEGESRIIQEGKNGIRQITTRVIYQDGVQTSKMIVSSVTRNEAIPEILMQGAKTEYVPIKINGRLIYISEGNAWMMEGSTENRTPLVSTGDLDGRILDLSSDGKWLLFSRSGYSSDVNGLWMLDLNSWDAEPIFLRVSNVIHFASWLPGSTRRFVYSGVEPSEQAPGWIALNDLRMQFVSDTGMLMTQEEILAPDDSGTYHWWGTEFALSDDARQLLFATPENIGIIDRLSGEKTELIRFTAYDKVRSDWAWIPGFTWDADNNGFYFTFHGKQTGEIQTFDPTDYHIAHYDLERSDFQILINNSGLFSYPAVSPIFSNGKSYLTWLQSELPQQAESERYRIMIADTDGRNQRAVYPHQTSDDFIQPQHIIWSPGENQNTAWIAFLSEGNIWLVNPFAGIHNQITSDGSITAFIWE